MFRSPLLPDLGDVLPVVSLTGSDSQSLDNMLELLLVGGLDPMHAMRMLMPPAWQSVDMIDPDLKAFYEYYATHMEPWDGPAGIVLTDGRYACCTLDRNGLRPARWVITKNRHITIASEAGVWDYSPEDVVRKGKLGPGEILALDLQTSELMDTKQVDDLLKDRHPYKVWLKKGVRYLQTDLIDPRLAAEPFDRDTLALFQKMYNVSAEERDEIIRVLAEDESEAVGSMGDDTPMPVLSRKVRSLYDYFRQQFAQVTNPPIDSLRESIVMSLQTQIGPECNIFVPAQQHAEQIVLSSPVLSQRKLRQIMGLEDSGVPHEFIDLQYRRRTRSQGRDPRGLRSGGSGGARRQAGAAAVGSLPRQGQDPHSCPARHRRRASPPGQDGPALQVQSCWSRPARRAMRIISPASSATARPRCIRTSRIRPCSTSCARVR